MPWSKKDYPQSLGNFMAPIRYKAMEDRHKQIREKKR
jgi:uncharacterized protein YdaT